MKGVINMKKVIAMMIQLFLLVTLMLSLSSGAYTPGRDYEVCGDFGYRVENGKARLISYEANEENVVVPAEVNGYPVIGLGINKPHTSGSMVFYKKDLVSVSLPDSIEFIGNGVFTECKNLSSITIPNGVNYIGENAFSYCESLTSVTIPESVNFIGNFAFGCCTSLATVDMRGGGRVGSSVFASCLSLTTVNIGENVTRFGMSAFDRCTSLVSIIIPENVKELSNSLFKRCSRLTTVIVCGPDTTIVEKDEPNPHISVLGSTFYGVPNLRTIYAFKGTRIYPYALERAIDFVPIAQVTLNGEKLKFDMPPIIQNDRVLVPLRAIFEALDAEVGWDDTTQMVTAAKDDLQLSLRIGEPRMLLDDREITLDVSPQIVHDRTLVPVRAISEALRANVEWDEETQTVIITTEN